MTTCDSCGNLIQLEWNLCPNCGNSIVREIKLQDSVVSGDIITTTNIQSSDSDVVRVAIEEAGKIINKSFIQIKSKSCSCDLKFYLIMQIWLIFKLI